MIDPHECFKKRKLIKTKPKNCSHKKGKIYKETVLLREFSGPSQPGKKEKIMFFECAQGCGKEFIYLEGEFKEI